jgi:hypothetical protein
MEIMAPVLSKNMHGQVSNIDITYIVMPRPDYAPGEPHELLSASIIPIGAGTKSTRQWYAATFALLHSSAAHVFKDDIAWIAQNSRMEYFLPFLVLHHDFSTNEAWPGLPDEAKSALPELVAANSE